MFDAERGHHGITFGDWKSTIGRKEAPDTILVEADFFTELLIGQFLLGSDPFDQGAVSFVVIFDRGGE